MQNSSAKTSPQYLVGVTTGALVLTCFGTIWGLQGPQIMIVITPVVTVALLALGLITRQAARRLHQEKETSEEQAQGQKISRRFGIVVGGELTMIAAAVVLLRLFNKVSIINIQLLANRFTRTLQMHQHLLPAIPSKSRSI